MEDKLKQTIAAYLKCQVTTMGFATVDRFNDAPEAHHPERVCKGAKTVVVFARAVSRGILSSPDYSLHTMHRSYHTTYSRLDDIAVDLCNVIEANSPARAVPVPSYAPMVFHGLEPWGILSLKHAGAKAGLGAIGRNGLLHHPRYGTLLRLGAVVTDAEMPGDEMITDFPCPEKCSECGKACPIGALDESRRFAKMTCLGHTIKHAIFPLSLKSEKGMKKVERVINTAGYNYWLTCNNCLTACPNNKRSSRISKRD